MLDTLTDIVLTLKMASDAYTAQKPVAHSVVFPVRLAVYADAV